MADDMTVLRHYLRETARLAYTAAGKHWSVEEEMEINSVVAEVRAVARAEVGAELEELRGRVEALARTVGVLMALVRESGRPLQ